MSRQPALLEKGRLNPGYLKLDLYCKGLRLASDCRMDDRRPVVRMRSGLGSGLEMRIPGSGGIHVNAPVVEDFARESPYEIHGPRANGRHWLTCDGKEVAEVELARRTRFMEGRTSSGKPMSSIGVIQGTYLGVYYGVLCANWKHAEDDTCRFCSIGVNLSDGDDRVGKTMEDVVETALAARDEIGVTFVHLNGGFDDSGRYLDRFGPVLAAIKSQTGMLTGFQVPPLPDLSEYGVLKRIGVDNVSLCFEIWNARRFEEVCPGKHRRAGLERYKEAIHHCARVVRFHTTNGEMIAGLEDPGDTMAAVDWLTDVGAVPTICVFRPVRDTPYADLPPPRVEDMVPVFAHAYARCMDRGLPIGIAPNVHVSIVLNPEEWRWLLPPGQRDRWKLGRLRLAAMRGAFRTSFALRRRLGGRRPSRVR